MKLGVAWYPEQWPEERWADDARRMADMGLSLVRLGEFAWARIEPAAGRFDWGWLDRAVATLAAAGLDIMLCTPTATPPKWLVDAHPEILAWARDGQPRRFGSRRHYCFSSPAYRREAARIAAAVADRYGAHPAVVAWQIDNEYGCHDTVESFAPAAAAAFRDWCRARYAHIATLNAAWGNAFWSMDYPDFASLDPPAQTVTEANPAHRLDWRRFSSDQVVAFNRAQAGIVRQHSPGRDIVHNYMGFETSFDHHDVARDLDVVGWDSYPLGFLDQGWDDDATKLRYARAGHPDFAAFHHDLYRGMAGRWSVLEQQPGPVNWAPWNPAPRSGQVRLWSLEALAHGAEACVYFRWRQAPFAQEAMHAGLLRRDHADAPAAAEVRAVAADLAKLPAVVTTPARVALIFDYAAHWLIGIQPQGCDFDPLRLSFEVYSGLRRLGLDIDILPAASDFSGYALVVAPVLPIVPDSLLDRLGDAVVLFGPRAGSKTAAAQLPETLAPGALQTRLPLSVTRVESLRPGLAEAAGPGHVHRWIEDVATALVPRLTTAGGRGVWYAHAGAHYLAGWPDAPLLDAVLAGVVAEAGLTPHPTGPDLRLRRCGDIRFAFNYGPDTLMLGDHDYVLGGPDLAPAGVAAWRVA